MKIKLAQCWDDGVVSDVRLCEILRKHHAKASFNLNVGTHRAGRYTEWKHRGAEVWKLSLAELPETYAGFLVANHTWSHPHLTRIAPDAALREITQGRDALEQIFGYPIEGFAYPFGDQNADVRQLVRQAGHLYARATENSSQVLPPADPMDLRPSCHFRSEKFWQEFEHARASGNVFYFWGHSYELHTEDDWLTFETTIQRLGELGEWVTLPSLFHHAT